MWRKAMLFGDLDSAEEILQAPPPRQAKELGREVQGFDQRRWEECRYEIVLTGCRAKFDQHADLRRFLLSTGNRVLVEASPEDSVWGIGLAADDPRREDPQQWQGRNLLGFALTEARATLPQQPEPTQAQVAAFRTRRGGLGAGAGVKPPFYDWSRCSSHATPACAARRRYASR